MENSHLIDSRGHARNNIMFVCTSCGDPIAVWENMEGGLCEGCEILAFVEIIDPAERISP
jgi:hypothetical protein